MIDPLWAPGYSTNIEIYGTMGLPVTKQVVLRNDSPYVLEEVVLRVGLCVYEHFPPIRLPNPEVFAAPPDDWVLEPRELKIGRMNIGENRTVKLSARISRVGRYFILLTATGKVSGEIVEEILWYKVGLVLEPRTGDVGRTTLLWVVTIVLLGVCLVIFITKKKHEPVKDGLYRGPSRKRNGRLASRPP